jgi:asparagine synthase (glutamine-hydrolysing)
VVRLHGFTVALSGRGGDELFGGYRSFVDVQRLYRMMRMIRWLPRFARVGLARAATFSRSEIVKYKLRDIVRTSGSVPELYFQRRRLMAGPRLKALGIDNRVLGLTDSFQAPETLASLVTSADDIVWSVSQLECRFYQGNMLLRDSDANGMAHSLEIRVPMLDQRMLDLVLPVPGPVRLPDGACNKHLLRTTFPDFLRPELLNQTKRGFALPIRRWMLGPMREMCEDAIWNLKTWGMLRSEGIEATWRSFLADPESPVWSRAFTLCVLGSYLHRMRLQ